jgi:predicted negative regulator of RcsB-dependent stress response
MKLKVLLALAVIVLLASNGYQIYQSNQVKAQVSSLQTSEQANVTSVQKSIKKTDKDVQHTDDDVNSTDGDVQTVCTDLNFGC